MDDTDDGECMIFGDEGAQGRVQRQEARRRTWRRVTVVRVRDHGAHVAGLRWDGRDRDATRSWYECLRSRM